MHTGRAYSRAREAVTRATGVVIPVYFASAADADAGEPLLMETVAAFRRELASPGAMCVCADGGRRTRLAGERVARVFRVRLVTHARNRGKLGPVLSGMRELLSSTRLRYLAIVDQDGDHFANELVNLVRAAIHVEAAASTDRVMVLGRRISRHRSMGYLRGELEELADRMLLDALNYHSIRSGRPLDLRFATRFEEYPDFHSGYKLFTRAAAEAVFSKDPWSEGLSDDCTYRHAVEAVMTTEAMVAGAILAVVNRSTIDEQPVTAFGKFHRPEMTANKIIWPCKRLAVPPEFVAQWLDNHLPRIQLGTLIPQGRAELLAVRRRVRSAFGLPDDGARDITRPAFI